MHRYETITIFDGDTPEDERKSGLERIESIISKRNGTLLDFEDWGLRKLAYPIRKKNQGHYVRVDYCGDGTIVEAIEQMLRHDQRTLRFMTVRQQADVDPEALKAAQSEKQEEPAAETAPEAESTPAQTETPAAETAESETESEEAPRTESEDEE